MACTVPCGSYRGSMWQLRDLLGCYGVYVGLTGMLPLCTSRNSHVHRVIATRWPHPTPFHEIALRGFYGAAFHEGCDHGIRLIVLFTIDIHFCYQHNKTPLIPHQESVKHFSWVAMQEEAFMSHQVNDDHLQELLLLVHCSKCINMENLSRYPKYPTTLNVMNISFIVENLLERRQRFHSILNSLCPIVLNKSAT